MTRAEECEAILLKVVEWANGGQRIIFGKDWGGNTLVISFGHMHTHAGVPHGDWETLVSQVYSLLHGGPGLSWETEHTGSKMPEVRHG